ncbi:MAG: CRISPR-associated endonuclease Cas1 [Phototrophicales bacterium]|nr:MAG: CRISPR-associated endonuclease Cas1 [Phototrophicales bacterium]RMG73636.1 MAG: CRISPR-associated endonuclease Cas1 [Chloroflexota bacterium]
MFIEHLIADEFGTHIGKYSKRLRITRGGKNLVEAPIMHLRSVMVLSKGVSISADALASCSENGIPVHYIDETGRAYAMLYTAGLTGTILTRREQLYAYTDARAIHFAIALTEAKLLNQAATLKYLVKNRKSDEVYSQLNEIAMDIENSTNALRRLSGEHIDNLRAEINGIEGAAARHYWAGIRQILPEQYGWSERIGRGATDPVNSLLNYGYGILYSKVEQSILLAGLDPYAGFLHVDRAGRPSLVLDLIEVFRQVAVDRVVFGLCNRNFVIEQDDAGHLSKETRRAVAEHVLERLESNVRHDNKRLPIRFVLQQQARHLASFLRRDCEAFIPFKAGW